MTTTKKPAVKETEDMLKARLQEMEDRQIESDKRNSELERDLKVLSDGVSEILRGMNTNQMPINKGQRQGFETNPDQHSTMMFDSEGNIISDVDYKVEIESAKKDKMEEMKFMCEKIKINIHPSQDQNDSIWQEVGVNGKIYVFMRGQEYIVPRYVVCVMLESQHWKYGSVQKKDATGQVNGYEYPRFSRQTLSFDVIEDSEKGREWMSRKYAAQRNYG